MKITVVVTQKNPEQVFTAFRFANFALGNEDNVTVFLTAEGVDAIRLDEPGFDIRGQITAFNGGGGQIFACGTCMKLRELWMIKVSAQFLQ